MKQQAPCAELAFGELIHMSPPQSNAMTTQELVQRGSLTLLSDELERIEALLGDGRAINSDGRWDSDLARLMVRLRFHQVRIKHRMAFAGKTPCDQ